MSTVPAPHTGLRGLVDEGVYLLIRTALAGMGSIPLEPCVEAARGIGRVYAHFPMNRKRVARAERNLAVAYPGWDQEQIREYAGYAYEHLFHLGVEMVHGPRLLTDDGWHRHLDLADVVPAVRTLVSAGPCLLITGHCGNWEMLGYTVAF